MSENPEILNQGTLLATRLGMTFEKKDFWCTAYNLKNEDGSGYYVHSYHPFDKICISPIWPKDTYVITPYERQRKTPKEINCSVKKGVEQIARDIEKRMEVYYIPEYLQCMERVKELVEARQQKNEAMNKMISLFPSLTKGHDNDMLYGSDIRLNMAYPESIRIEISDVTFEAAADILRIISDAKMLESENDA